jgi:LAGLIDADG endonuclease
MLNLIVNFIGGKIKIKGKNRFVIWDVNNIKQIQKIIKIFIKYPPLTTRLKAQLTFMLECFEQNNVD